MSLSNDLISQFVKVTKDTAEVKKESTVYGTVKEYDGTWHVQLDGSDRLTPVSTTVAMNDGERVAVLIKNHTATVTGNVSSPSANSSDVTNLGTQVDEMSGKIDEFGIIVADKVSADVLEAERARIDTLVSENATIKDTLTANNAKIHDLEVDMAEIDELKVNKAEVENLVVTKLDAKIAEFDYASAEDLEATNAKINNLDATYATIEDLTAAEAQIGKLQTGKLDAATADITYAKVSELNATNANVTNLGADVADINTLIFGSASGSVMQAEFANAVIALIGNARIKSAMIESIAANKITAGDIITNNVTVKSEDGKLLISDETIQISDENRVRVQIGKDANNDYSINIWDEDGNLMFSKGGITDKAIKNAIIRDDMVSGDANISASKLDISSLFREINGSTETIKSSKIYFNDKTQTLDVAFNSLSTEVEGTKETVETQGTELSVLKGKIESKIWQQDITTSVNSSKTDGVNLLLKSGTERVAEGDYYEVARYTPSSPLVADETYTISLSITPAEGTTMIGVYLSIGYAPLCTWTISSTDKQPLSATFTAYYHQDRTPSDNEENAKIYIFRQPNDGTVTGATTIHWIKIERGNKVTDWSPAPEDELYSDVTVLSDKYSMVEQDIAGIKTQIGEHTTKIEEKADNTTVTSVTNRVSSLESDVGSFKTSVSETYATKTELQSLDERTDQNAEDLAKIVTDFNADIEGLQTQIDGSITTWFYEVEPTLENEPAVDWTTTDLKNIHLGDLYYDTITGYCYRWQVQDNVYSWQRITDTDVTKALADAAAAQDTADSKRRVFYEQPVAPYEKGDLWVQGETGDILRCKTPRIVGSFLQSHWVLASKYTDDTKANAVQEELTSKHAELVQTIEGFETTVSETYATKIELDLLPYDGRNLVLSSDTVHSNSEYFVARYQTSTPLIAGETYTVTLSTTPGEGVTALTVFLSHGYAHVTNLPIIGTSKQTVSATFTAYYTDGRTPDDGEEFWAVDIYRLPNDGSVTAPTTIHWIKVEKGDKATDWTPAPEDLGDIKSRVSSSETKIEQNAQSINSIASRTETVENKFGEYSTTSEMNSAIEQKADSITSTVTKTIEDISVGGRNLLRDSRLIRLLSNNNNKYPITCTEMQEEDITFYRIQRTDITMNPTTLSTYNSIPTSQYAYSEMVGKQVTLSFKARASEDCTCTLMSTLASDGISTNFSKNTTSESLPAEWKTFAQVIDEFPEVAETAQLRWCPLNITIPDGKIDEFYIDVRDWKFELGNKATDWTPAPEDVDSDISGVIASAQANEARITTAESSIRQLADQISTLVTDETGASLMTQTEDGWTFSIGDIRKAISDASEGINSLDGSVDDLGSELDGLRTAVDKLGEFGSYIKIKTDGDQPCIELGSEGSSFKVLITNTDIRFMEGTVVPAYINNQSLNIDKAVIEDELQIGGFVWKRRTNGNVGLIWKGETS